MACKSLWDSKIVEKSAIRDLWSLSGFVIGSMRTPRICVISLTVKEDGCLGRTTSDTEIFSPTRVSRNHRRMVRHLLTQVATIGGDDMRLGIMVWRGLIAHR